MKKQFSATARELFSKRINEYLTEIESIESSEQYSFTDYLESKIYDAVYGDEDVSKIDAGTIVGVKMVKDIWQTMLINEKR